MRQELNGLRQQTNQQNVVAELDAQQLAAQNPLTYIEKKALIAEIHKLPQEGMERVIEIVTAAKPDTGDDEEIEIPLDELDTATLRQLQRYVASLKKPKVEAQRPLTKAAPAPKRANIHAAPAPYASQPAVSHQQYSAPAPAPAAAGSGFGARRPLPTEPATVRPIFRQEMAASAHTATTTSTTTSTSTHMDGALGEIDFSAMSEMMDADDEASVAGDAQAAAQASAAAWGASAPPSSSHLSSGPESGFSSHPPTGISTWGSAGNELLEKQQREQRLQAQERAVQQQRELTEAASVAAIADAAARHAEQQRQAAMQAAAEAERVAQAAAAQRELDRQAREAAVATIRGDNTELARHIAGVAAHGASSTWL